MPTRITKSRETLLNNIGMNEKRPEGLSVIMNLGFLITMLKC